jgi:uncharacterized repeat protein (TIGR01451 family)
MKFLKEKIVLLLIFSLFLYGANVGDSILNKASISYTISGVEKNETTNEVNNTVVATPATIEFLAYAPSSKEQLLLQPTFYKEEKNVSSLVPVSLFLDGQFSSIPTLLVQSYPSSLPLLLTVQETQSYLENDFVIVKVVDIDSNTHADSLDTITITLTDPATQDTEELILTETNVSSGVFVGYIQTNPHNPKNNNGSLTVASNSHITAIYQDNGSEKEVVAKAKVAKVQFRLLVQKTQSKDEASLGEFVQYTITVENISDIDYKNVLVKDIMSEGLEYQEGSFQVDSNFVTPKLTHNNMQLEYTLDTLLAHQKVTIKYVALIGTGIIDNKVTNLAYAGSAYAGFSNTAKTTLIIKEELYNSEGFIVGYIYDKNCTQKEGKNSLKCGVKDVRLYLEDGRYIITDENGKYHFSHVKEGTHVIAIDKESIKGRYKVAKCKESVDFSNSYESLFVDIYKASIKRANFCLEKLEDKAPRVELLVKAREIKTTHEIELNVTVNKNLSLSNIDFVLSFNKEILEYVKGSFSLKRKAIYDKGFWLFRLKEDTKNFSLRLKVLKDSPKIEEILGMLIFDTKKALEQRSKIAEIDLQLKKGDITFKKASDKVVSKITGVEIIQEPYWSQPKSVEQEMPKYTKEEVDTLGEEAKIIWPPKGWIPTIPSAKFAVLFPKGARVELLLNGKKVDGVHYEGLFRSSNGKMRVMHYKGIDLYEGKNEFVALIKKGKKVLKELKRVIYVESHAPKELKFLPQYSYLIADGKRPIVIAIKLIGPSGHPLRGGLKGAFTTNSDYAPLEKQNGKGLYKVQGQGIAYIKLKPTTKHGDVHLKIPLANGATKDLVVSLKPYMRDWIVVGFAEGTIGYKTVDGNKESLSKSDIEEGFYKKGELSLFAKGKIKGKWLLTLVYDSRRKENERALFDRIDPNKYYMVYKDGTSQHNDTASRSKLYIKIENDKFFAMYGDFNPSFKKSELASYSRDFTGFNSEYKHNNIHIKSFLAKSEELFFRDEFQGDGTRGYYFLKNQHLVEGSEEITIEVRNKDNELEILSIKQLEKDRDYEIDYDKGRIYFKEPIFSYDNKFNPIYVVVKYEVDAKLQDSYSYGVRTEYSDKNKSYALGATFINEDRGDNRYRLYGVDVNFKINPHLTLKAELAKSKNSINSKKIDAQAQLAELLYEDKNITASLFYRKEDDDFGLGQLSETLSATRKIGLKVEKKIDNNISLEGSIFSNKDYKVDGNKQSLLAFLKVKKEQELYRAFLSYKYKKSHEQKSEHDIVLELEKSFFDNKINSSLFVEKSLSSSDAKVSTQIEWRYDKNTTMGFSIARANENHDISWNATFDVDHKIDKTTLLHYSRYFETEHIFDSFAVSKEFLIGDKYTLSLGFEKGISSDGSDSYSSYSIGNKFEDENISLELATDFKDSKDNKKVNITAGAYIKKSDEVAFLARIDYYREWDKEKLKKDIEAKLSFVYRPISEDFILLSQLEYNKEYTKEFFKNPLITQKFISNSHLNWEVNENWELSLHYGLKFVEDTIEDKKYKSISDVLGVVNEFDLNKNWALGVQGALRHSYSSNDFDYSFGLFLKRNLFKNSNLILGYNLVGFSDDDFSQRNFYHQGFYLTFRIKFDTSTLKSITKEGVK